MKIKKDELTQIAIDSKCTICGKDIGYQLWECTLKNKQYFFAHYNCLKNRKKEKKND